jgi:hypothetical protein
MATQQKKCKHPACTCSVSEDGGDYCSPYCHDAKDTVEISCNCGHAGCGTATEAPQTMTGSSI